MVWNFDLPEMPAGPVMELHGARKRFHVPQGLKPLLEEMSLEVLREQPDNIYEFLADYLKRKANTEAGNEEDEDSQEEEETEMEQIKDEVDESELVTEQQSFLTEEGVLVYVDQFGVITNTEGNVLPPETKLFSQSGTELSSEARGALNIDDAHRYATVIQAAFRGHLARKVDKTDEAEKSERQVFTTEDGMVITMMSNGALVDPEGETVPPGTILITAKGQPAIVNSAGNIVLQEVSATPSQELGTSEAQDEAESSIEPTDEWQGSDEEWGAQGQSQGQSQGQTEEEQPVPPSQSDPVPVENVDVPPEVPVNLEVDENIKEPEVPFNMVDVISVEETDE